MCTRSDAWGYRKKFYIKHNGPGRVSHGRVHKKHPRGPMLYGPIAFMHMPSQVYFDLARRLGCSRCTFSENVAKSPGTGAGTGTKVHTLQFEWIESRRAQQTRPKVWTSPVRLVAMRLSTYLMQGTPPHSQSKHDT